ncbi:hypothetical protein GGF31_007680 [Allomyces arbusculus]|nr:hypothetical protein GGF31_007680 [Allomyces arbusculus]
MALDAPPSPPPPAALHSMPFPPPFSFAAHARMVSGVSVAMSNMSSTASPFAMHSRTESATSDVSMRSHTAPVASDTVSSSRSASPIADVPAALRCDSSLALAWAAEGENAVMMALGDTDATAAAALGIADAVLDAVGDESDDEDDDEDEGDDQDDEFAPAPAPSLTRTPLLETFCVSPAPWLTCTPLVETNAAPFSRPEQPRPAAAPEATGAMRAVVRKTMAGRRTRKVVVDAN